MHQRAGSDGPGSGSGSGSGSEPRAVPSQASPHPRTVHAFGDDALGDHDAAALAELVAKRQVSPRELASAAVARAGRMQPLVDGVHHPDHERAVAEADRHVEGWLAGVPTYVKDNVDVA